MLDLASWLGGTPLSLAIQQRTEVVALLQAVHILMIALVFGSALLVALRVLGQFRADEPLESVWARFAPWLWGGFAVMVVTGAFLIIGEPVRQASALSFWLKMALVACALLGVRSLRSRPSPALARLLIAAFVAIIFLGRAIAYDVEVWGTWSFGA